MFGLLDSACHAVKASIPVQIWKYVWISEYKTNVWRKNHEGSQHGRYFLIKIRTDSAQKNTWPKWNIVPVKQKRISQQWSINLMTTLFGPCFPVRDYRYLSHSVLWAVTISKWRVIFNWLLGKLIQYLILVKFWRLVMFKYAVIASSGKALRPVPAPSCCTCTGHFPDRECVHT